MHCTPRFLLTSVFSIASHRPPTAPLAFLTPAVSLSQSASFSSSPISQLRKKGDHDRNRNRGVSALRRTGLRRRQKLSVSLANLPQPVLDPRLRSAVEVDDDHGLWEFFNNDRVPLATPSKLAEHGRAWSVAELRRKDWDDLWRLWWTCVKEKNRLATLQIEMERIGSLSGQEQLEPRQKEVRFSTSLAQDMQLTWRTDQEDSGRDQACAYRTLVRMGRCSCRGHGGPRGQFGS